MRLIAAILFTLLFAPAVNAGAGFSGSDICQYRCLSYEGSTLNNADNVPSGCGAEAGGVFAKFDSQGRVSRFYCSYNTAEGSTDLPAIPTPPTLEVIQVWFIRILYAIWAFAGIFFTFIVIGIGVQYMFSFGNQVAVAEVIKKFQRFVIGFGLVFLSYPLLNTFFAILPISDSAGCFSNINMPGFQFFFPSSCTVSGLEYAKCIEQNQCETQSGGRSDECYIECSNATPSN